MKAVPEKATDLGPLSAGAVRRVLDEGGCPLCRLLEPVVDSLLTEWLGARRLSTMTRVTLRRAQGFCAPHAWWLLAEGASRAVPAPGLDQAIQVLLLDLRQAMAAYGTREPGTRLHPAVLGRTGRPSKVEPVLSRLTPTGRCPLCLDARRVEETVGGQLLAHLRADELRACYTPASALCVPHFRWALQAATDTVVFDCLVAAERMRVEALLAAAPGAGWRAGLAHMAGAARVMTARGQDW